MINATAVHTTTLMPANTGFHSKINEKIKPSTAVTISVPQSKMPYCFIS